MKAIYIFMIIGAFILGTTFSWDYIESAIPPTPAWRFFQFNDTISETLNHTATSYRDLFEWNSDGSILYVINGTIVGTYNTTDSTYLQEFDTTPDSYIPMDISIKDNDGSQAFVLGDNNDRIESYSLGTPWDITSMSNQGDYDISGDGFTSPTGIFTKQDGTRLYITDSGADVVAEYHLSSPWNVTSISFEHTQSLMSNSENPQGVFFKPDGTKMYVLSAFVGTIAEYDLSTAWDVTSATYLQDYDITGLDPFSTDVYISPNGKWLTMMSWGNVDLVELITPWDISTSTPRNAKDISSQDGVHRGLTLGLNGTKMYAAAAAGTNIEEWDLGTTVYVDPTDPDIVTLQVNTPADDRLGGVYAQSCTAGDYVSGIDTDGSIICTALP